MTEIAFDLNAPVDFATDQSNELPRVDAARGAFITSRNEEILLADKPISALVIQMLQSQGKPKIPMIEVTILGRKQSEPHAGHEGYQARLKEWEEESQVAVMHYLFTVGVKGTPPPEFVEEQLQYFPNATAQELKYLWVASRLPDEDMGAFTEAVMGRSLPTQKAVEQVSNFTASA